MNPVKQFLLPTCSLCFHSSIYFTDGVIYGFIFLTVCPLAASGGSQVPPGPPGKREAGFFCGVCFITKPQQSNQGEKKNKPKQPDTQQLTTH